MVATAKLVRSTERREQRTARPALACACGTNSVGKNKAADTPQYLQMRDSKKTDGMKFRPTTYLNQLRFRLLQLRAWKLSGIWQSTSEEEKLVYLTSIHRLHEQLLRLIGGKSLRHLVGGLLSVLVLLLPQKTDAQVFTEIIGLYHSTAHFIQADFADVDLDGDKEVVYSECIRTNSNYIGYYDYQNVVCYHQNIGSNSPTWGGVTCMINVSFSEFDDLSNIVFPIGNALVDINNDGLSDIYTHTSVDSVKFIFEGGSSWTGFNQTDIPFYGIPSEVQVTDFADVDSDGDEDAFWVSSDGTFGFQENISTTDSILFDAPIANPFELTTIEGLKNPKCVDITMDGLPDMMFLHNCEIKYFPNIGTASSPIFSTVSASTGVVVPSQTCNTAKFAVGDVTYDNLPDLMYWGSPTSYLRLFRCTNTVGNTPPVCTDSLLQVQENEVYPFTPADFGFFDADADTLTWVIIESLPEKGILKLGNNSIEANEQISMVELTQLTYASMANQSGSNYTTFKFRLHDGAGESGVITMTIDVASDGINFPPTGQNEIIETVVNQPLTFSENDFEYLDQDGDTLARIRFNMLPNSGIILLNGVAIETNTDIAVSQFSSLIYMPSTDVIGIPADVCSFQLGDINGLSTESYLLKIHVAKEFVPIANMTGIFVDVEADSSVANLNINRDVTFVDLDNDGDQDLLQRTYVSTIKYYENIGCANYPIFDTFVLSPFGLTVNSIERGVKFSDIDNDGDYDFFLGKKMHKNFGTPEVPQFANAVSFSTMESPDFTDIDNDGDFDLYYDISRNDYDMGFYSEIAFFQNIGTANQYIWDGVQINPFGLDDMLNENYATDMQFIDLDQDQRHDLIFDDNWTSNGGYKICQNDGTLTVPHYALCQNLVPANKQPIAFADLNSDTYQDYIYFSTSDYKLHIRLNTLSGNTAFRAPTSETHTLYIEQSEVHHFVPEDFNISLNGWNDEDVYVSITTLPTNGQLTFNGNPLQQGQQMMMSEITLLQY